MPFFFMILLLAKGDTLPHFTKISIQGDTIDTKKLKNKVIIFNFWTTWCPACIMEIPGLIDLYKNYKDKGLMVIGISLNEDAEDVIDFINKNKVIYPVIMGDEEINQIFGRILFIPTTFIIAKNNIVYDKFVGYRSEAVMEEIITQLLNK